MRIAFGGRPRVPPLPTDWPAVTVERSGAFQLAVRDSDPQGDPRELPILLIHGLGSSALLFARAWGALTADGTRVIAVDLPGCGETRGPRHSMGLTFYVQHLLGVLDRRNIPAAHWVGHSMGAQISMLAALSLPERVAGMTLVSPAGLEPFDRVQRRLLLDLFRPASIAAARSRQVRAQMEAGFHRMPAEAEWLIQRRTNLSGGQLERYAHAFSRGVRGMLDEPVHENLEKLTQPTKLVIGAQDALVPNRFFRPADTPTKLLQRAFPRFPNAEMAVIDRAGHLLPFEQPEAFAEQVRSSHAKLTDR
ncbi:MAG: hypothetical protein CMN30_25550 [Sandaracinus sp.]|nr:hypothetical protein [Sandaracinus sp.]